MSRLSRLDAPGALHPGESRRRVCQLTVWYGESKHIRRRETQEEGDGAERFIFIVFPGIVFIVSASINLRNFYESREEEFSYGCQRGFNGTLQ
jgi:hypothetical protein